MFSSVATRVTLSLVITVTVVLAAGGSLLFHYYMDNQKVLFKEQLELNADQLEAGIALAAWNIDEEQIKRVIQSAMQDKNIFGIVLETAENRYAFTRDESWNVFETSAQIPQLDNVIKADREITIQGKMIGHISLYMTQKFLHAAISHLVAILLISIAVLDLFLIVILYSSLWKSVLKPLKLMERYAISINPKQLSETVEINSPLVGEFGAVYETMSSMVTQLKAHISEISEINERFWNMVQSFPIPLSIYTPENGEIVLVNQRFTETYGYTEQDIPFIDRWFERAYPDVSYRQEIMKYWSKQAIEAKNIQGAVNSREYQVVCKNGDVKTVEIGGVVSGQFFLGILVDVTDRRVAEREVQNYQLMLEELVEQRTNELVIARDKAELANRAKSLFLANMSHELRTPLNSVIGFSRLMGQDFELTPQQKRYIDIINRSGSHLLVLINDILDFSKIESGKMELSIRAINLNQLVIDVTDMLRHRAEQLSIKMSVDCVGLPSLVRADSSKLRQVLINLVSNAIKFTPKGQVEVIAKGELKGDDVDVLFKVKDTGIGIEERDQDRIFEPFVQVENKHGQSGTGLGLVISRQYIQMMGGELKLHSTVGEGSTFSFQIRFPIAKEVERDEETMVNQRLQFSNCRVLIVDDVPEIRLLMRRLLEPMGLEIIEAIDCMQALDKILQFSPQIIFLDWRMPGRCGVDLAKDLRGRKDIDQPVVIIMSGNTLEATRQEALAAGVDDFLSKPIDFEKLKILMRQYASDYLEDMDSDEALRAETYLQSTLVTQPVLENVLSDEDMKALSTNARDQFEEALRELNPEKIGEALKMIRKENEDLANKLNTYTETMRYRELWNVFGLIA